MNLVDCYTGCLLGGAIGDALGAPIEFLSIDQIRQKHGPQGLNSFVEYPDNSGEFTDDTQMTLFTAEGLLRNSHRLLLNKSTAGAPNQITFVSYLRWLHTQGNTVSRYPAGVNDSDLKSGWLMKRSDLFRRRSPGNTCIGSLSSGIEGTIENPINNSKGCGGIMRMAPVGLFEEDHVAAFAIGAELAAITHGHPSGYLSAGVFAAIIQQLLSGQDLMASILPSLSLITAIPGNQETVDAVMNAIELYQFTDQFSEIFPVEVPEKIAQLGKGWVAEEALAISLYCSLLFEDDFQKGVLASVNHSGDSDSTGSITGNILGLINGIGGIPQGWINNLRSADLVWQVGKDLHKGCKGDMNEPDEEFWEKYPAY
jgi:ADP-ribosylglycohydrolase